jgi:hypothetical protein
MTRFTVGFAIVDRDELAYLRVQDHLRKMGLARLAIGALFAEGVHRVAKSSSELQTPHESAYDRKGLERLFRSVEIERTPEAVDAEDPSTGPAELRAEIAATRPNPVTGPNGSSPTY